MCQVSEQNREIVKSTLPGSRARLKLILDNTLKSEDALAAFRASVEEANAAAETVYTITIGRKLSVRLHAFRSKSVVNSYFGSCGWCTAARLQHER